MASAFDMPFCECPDNMALALDKDTALVCDLTRHHIHIPMCIFYPDLQLFSYYCIQPFYSFAAGSSASVILCN